MNNYQIFLLSPLVIGGLIAVINNEGVNNFTEKIEAWIRRVQINAYGSSSFITNWFVRPIFWVLVQFHNWTDKMISHGLKNGIRITASLYFLLLAIYTAVAIGFVVVMAILVFYGFIFVMRFMGNEDSNSTTSGFNLGSSIFSSGGSSKKEYSLFGKDKISYFDKNGKVVATSEVERRNNGQELNQYYDASGKKVGFSESLKTREFLKDNKRFYNEAGQLVGTSELNHGILSGTTETFKNKSKNVIGIKKTETNIFGSETNKNE
jgi:hypothetical protein